MITFFKIFTNNKPNKKKIFYAFLIFLIPNIATSKQLTFNYLFDTKTNKVLFNSNNKGKTNNLLGFTVENYNYRYKSKIALALNNNKDLFFDNSFLEYRNKKITFGIGKKARNWSFSPNSSLIYSKNARPASSLYFTIENQIKPVNPLLSWIGPSSFELFNSILSTSDSPKNSMLLGYRLVVEPIYNLKIEFLKTAQWGGNGYSKSLSAIKSTLVGNTNDKESSNINQMAGIGFSFLTDKAKVPFRIYGQVVGEDEAGNLPSCLIHLIGGELKLPKDSLFSQVGFEYIDTRINYTTNGFCGPNTAYNNSHYKYTNYGSSIGATIDTEGKSLSAWASKKLSPETNLMFSIKNLLINETSLPNHRLSPTKQSGWILDIGASRKINSIYIQSKIIHQSFNLTKINIKKGLSINLSAKYKF